MHPIVSIVDRASKYAYLELLPQGTAEMVSHAICKRLHLLGKNGYVHTLTSDNGKEFAAHEKIISEIGGEFFFAKPYHSWERGLNEHTNGLVRKYFSKGTPFAMVTPEKVAEVERKLNNRPREVFNFRTPAEIFMELTGLWDSS